MASNHRSPYVAPAITDLELGGVGKQHEFAELTIRQGFIRKVFGERSGVLTGVEGKQRSNKNFLHLRRSPRRSVGCNCRHWSVHCWQRFC